MSRHYKAVPVQYRAYENVLLTHIRWILRESSLIDRQYLQMSDFSFPFAPIIHECTVNNESEYFPAHKVVCKNLEENAVVSFTINH